MKDLGRWRLKTNEFEWMGRPKGLIVTLKRMRARETTDSIFEFEPDEDGYFFKIFVCYGYRNKADMMLTKIFLNNPELFERLVD